MHVCVCLPQVRAILSGAHAPLPYLIFGPPGTGKTMTLTEAAVQLHRTDTAARLLLAAPSNTAADQLMLRLMDKGVSVASCEVLGCQLYEHV